MNEPLWTTADLSAEWKVAEKTLRNMRSRGEGPPAVKIGAAVRYRPSDVARWLDDQAESPRRLSVAPTRRAAPG